MTSGREAPGFVRIVLVIVVLLVVAASVVSVRGVASYDPLEAGTTSIYPGAKRMEATAGEPETYELPYRHGAEGSVSFSVSNRGRWGVKIVDFPILHQRIFSLFKIAAVEVGDPAHQDRASVRFAPFTLGPDEERLITLRGVFTDCDHYEAGSGNAFESFQVRYRFLWSTRTESVPLPARLKVTSPEDAGCPLSRPASDNATPQPAPPLPATTP